MPERFSEAARGDPCRRFATRPTRASAMPGAVSSRDELDLVDHERVHRPTQERLGVELGRLPTRDVVQGLHAIADPSRDSLPIRPSTQADWDIPASIERREHTCRRGAGAGRE